ncbi:MAG: TolC family protein [Cyclobacteriaceae bacterium]|nr:TolC family protein [Cyclobacteriaceae bacterium SS2]
MAMMLYACAPGLVPKKSTASLPDGYGSKTDTANVAQQSWQDYFADPHLVALIDTAMKNNQELRIFSQELEIARNEVMERKGEYLPFVGLGAEAGLEKVGRYTRDGAVEESLQIREDEAFPEPLPDYMLGAYASWEIDIWHKLRNAKKSAMSRFLASAEGRKFLVTNLVSEIADTYYELLALDNQLEIIRQNIQIQTDALNVVKLQKQSARVTELAVRRFEAQVLNTRSMQFVIQQRIVETENRLNFLLGRYPEQIQRDPGLFNELSPDVIQFGLPADLLENRPDIREAELNLIAADLDIKVAKAHFYPTVDLKAGLGFQAFNPGVLLSTPESLIYSAAGGLTAPLINRNAIKAAYFTAGAKQIQAVYEYDQTVLNAYIEVVNQMSRISNLKSSYDLKARQVDALTESVDISNNLFRSARADYMEVLLTQREALESRFELVETKMQQLHAWVATYRALGGGWR